jgi:TonB family protein
VVAPILVNLPTAAYPTVAKKLKIEGNVTLSLLVDEDGRVQEVRVTKVPEKDRGFSEAAMKAARGARFEPATKGGIEVKYWHSVTIRFEL